MNPIFSVIIPVLNRASSILPTLKSVQTQDFINFECIVVDDGSDDGEELQAVIASLGDHRFFYVQKSNGGASSARNFGIAKAVGRYVAFLDSDDLFMPHKLSQDEAILSATAADTVVFAPMLVDRGRGRAFLRPKRGPRSGEHLSDYLTRADGWVPSSTIALHRKLARRVLYDETISYGDDTHFALRLFAMGARFRMHERPLAIMNDRPSSDRLSQQIGYAAVAEWLEDARSLMSESAFLAYRGRHLARMAARSGRRLPAVRFYVAALSRGAFPPKLALKALLQILLPPALLRWKPFQISRFALFFNVLKERDARR